MTEQEGQLVAQAANTVAAWCGMRDADALTPGSFDWFVLFGGGVVGSLDTLANAMRRGIARHFAIVGGRGHATFGLDRAMEQELPTWDDALCPKPCVGIASEAQMLAALLLQRHGLRPDLLETDSTNCGNNIAYLLDLFDARAYAPASVVLCQDAVMQRRMDATWRRQVADRPRYGKTRVANWASYRAKVAWREGRLAYEEAPRGMWEPTHYLRLLSGEVTRLTDDAGGYGPRGSDFVVHVDIPSEVAQAHAVLRAFVGSESREC